MKNELTTCNNDNLNPLFKEMKLTPIIKENNLMEIAKNYKELAKGQFKSTVKTLEEGSYIALILKKPNIDLKTGDLKDYGTLVLKKLTVYKNEICVCEGHFDFDFDGWNVILGYKKLTDFNEVKLTVDNINLINGIEFKDEN